MLKVDRALTSLLAGSLTLMLIAPGPTALRAARPVMDGSGQQPAPVRVPLDTDEGVSMPNAFESSGAAPADPPIMRGRLFADAPSRSGANNLESPTRKEVVATGHERPSVAATRRATGSGRASAAPLIERDLAPLSSPFRESASPNGRVLVQDDFSDTNSGWTVMDSDESRLDYVDGEYLVQVRRPGLIQSVDVQQDVNDFGLQVEAHAASAAEPVAAGVKFAASLAGAPIRGHLYFMLHPATGEFSLLQSRDGAQSWLIPWTPSGAIRRGAEKNLLRVERQADDVRLIINGTTVKTLSLPHSGPDRTGLFAYHLGQTGAADALFDNFLLEALDEESPTATPRPAGPTVTGTRPTPTPTRRTTATPATPPSPSPTPVPSPYSEVVLLDNFSDPSSGWPTYHRNEMAHEYRNGEYHMRLSMDGFTLPVVHEVEVRSFDLQVDVRLSRDDLDSGIGLVFGKANDGGAVYVAAVSPFHGRFALAKLDKGNVESIVPGTTSDAVRRGSAINRLRLINDGTRLSFFVNNAAVFTVNLPVPIGHVGLFLGNWAGSETVEASFDDLVLTAPHGSVLRPPAIPTYAVVRLEDDFSRRDNRWPEMDERGCKGEYAGGEYRFTAASACRAGFSSVLGRELVDVSVDAHLRDDQSQAIYGLVFGDGWQGFGYDFMVDPNTGTYWLGDHTGGTSDSLVPVAESAAIRRGAATNRLRVITTDQYILLVINDVRVASVRRLVLGDRVGFAVGRQATFAPPFGANSGTLTESDLVRVPALGQAQGLAPNQVTTSESFFDNFVLRVPFVAAPPATVQPLGVRHDPDVIFHDDFTDPSSGWPKRYDRTYSANEYQLAFGIESGLKFVPSPKRFADLDAFEVSATTRIDRVPPGTGRSQSGLFIAYDSNDKVGFHFQVDPARRTYAVLRQIDGQLDPIPVVPWTAHHAIRATGNWNALSIARRHGAAVELYVNDTLLTSLDLPYRLETDGVSAFQDGDSNGSVASFDDYEVRQLEANVSARGGARTPTPLHAGTAVPPAMLTVTAAAADRSRRAYLPLAMRVGTNGR